jgi:hypothetical protein
MSRRFGEIRVVAPAMPKNQRGINGESLRRASTQLQSEIMKHQADEPARLSVWAYKPNNVESIENLWWHFNPAAWIEWLPSTLADKDRPTRLAIESRIAPVKSLLHEVSGEIYPARKVSHLPLPLRNFKSPITEKLLEHWYNDLSVDQLRHRVRSVGAAFRQRHTRNRCHIDDRDLVFTPARDSECHGKPHPTGDNTKCFLAGKFRFGAALYAGFHYDVAHEKPNQTMKCVLLDSTGSSRDMKPERRRYINIFPNDYLLPRI